MTVSYIVPCWINDEETNQLTKDALLSMKNTDQEAQIIVIDNGSELGGGFMREIADIYIRNSENLGYVQAVNQGFKLATGELIAVCNNDIIVPHGWKEVAEDVFRHDKIGCLHFRMVPYDQEAVKGVGIAYEGKERWCTNSFYITSRYFLDQLKDIEEKLEPYPGLIDENYGRGIDDDYDFHNRVFAAGYKSVYSDKVSYRHMMTHSFNKLPTNSREAERKHNREYFITKWGKDPEIMFQERWPDQWAQDYWPGFVI